MTSSATSTDRRDADARASFQPWHFFLLLAMAGATAAVMLSRETHPAALLLLSAAVICSGLVAIALTRAVSGFFNRTPSPTLPISAKQTLERDKALVLRSLKELEFDRAGQTDLTWDQSGRVRRALVSLALRTNTGVVLPDDALLSVAVHETGHAIGLPHSSDSNDVMFPATRTGTLSDRDRRTAAVLYRLPPGPVRDLPEDGR